jgi:hypothetical protein
MHRTNRKCHFDSEKFFDGSEKVIPDWFLLTIKSHKYGIGTICLTLQNGGVARW